MTGHRLSTFQTVSWEHFPAQGSDPHTSCAAVAWRQPGDRPGVRICTPTMPRGASGTR